MERKLVSQGRGALTVTLPAKWLQKKNLVAGDVIFIEETTLGLSISSQKRLTSYECTLNLKGAEKSEYYHQILAQYLEGYDKIIILHDAPDIIQDISSALLGMILEKHTPTQSIITSVIAVPEENFNVLLRRATHILIDQAQLLIDATQGIISRKQIQQSEDLLDFNLRYCLRYLTKYNSNESAYRLFLFSTTLESCGDYVSDIAKHIGKRTELAKEIKKIVVVFTQSFFSNNFSKAYTVLRSFRRKRSQKTFLDGLCFSLAESLYDNIGYLFSSTKEVL